MTATLRLPPPADVTALDHDQILGRLTDLLLSLYPWLALTKADLARLHLEAMGHLGDQFAFLINRLGRGSRLLTADQRRDILALVKLTAYRPRGATAAKAAMTFTLAKPATAVVIFAAGRVVKTEEQLNPRRFHLLEDAVIDVGETTVTAFAEHSDEQTESILSTSLPGMTLRMAAFPYIDKSMIITSGAGLWTEVENLLASTPVDRHYTTTIDASDRVVVRFGGINGQGVVPLDLVQYVYKTGGGSSGNVGAGALTILEGNTADANGIIQRVAVTNAEASPGYDRESAAEIQVNAPAAITVPRSAVSRPDYEGVAERVAGVAFSLMLTRNQHLGIGENEGNLYVVPDDGAVASQALLDSVAAEFGDAVTTGNTGVYVVLPPGPTPKTVTFQLRVRAASYKVIDLSAKLYLRKGAVPSVVKAAVQAAFAAYFAVLVPASSVGMPGSGLVKNPRLNFGYYLQDVDGMPTGHLPFSDIFNVVRDVPGVREIGDLPGEFALNGQNRNVPIALWEFPRPGLVQLVTA